MRFIIVSSLVSFSHSCEKSAPIRSSRLAVPWSHMCDFKTAILFTVQQFFSKRLGFFLPMIFIEFSLFHQLAKVEKTRRRDFLLSNQTKSRTYLEFGPWTKWRWWPTKFVWNWEIFMASQILPLSPHVHAWTIPIRPLSFFSCRFASMVQIIVK